MEANLWSLAGAVAAVVASFAVGLWGGRSARVTDDFCTARQPVPVKLNAAAVSGQYLSAAAFLGVSGLLLKNGVDALWYPVGFAAGCVALMLFVVAPVRRSGAYTLPDFAVARLDSDRLRVLCTVLVVLVSWLYLVPQLQAAGLVWNVVTGLPYWSGVLCLVGCILLGALTGRMHSVTVVRAFQYWVKLAAVFVPTFALFLVFLVSGPPRQALTEPAPPVFAAETEVEVHTDVQVRVSAPVWLQQDGSSTYLSPGEYTIASGAQLRFPAGAPAPVVLDAEPLNADWLRPGTGDLPGVLHVYSVLLATLLGTMGLPHMVPRFYSNLSGQAARRTGFFVVVMVGAFLVCPMVLGLLSRLYVPQLLVTGHSDAAVLLLPTAMLDNWLGAVLSAVVTAGAFAAFFAAGSGLLFSAGGVLASDVLRTRNVHWGYIVACPVPVLLALAMEHQDIVRGVGLAFAMSASTFAVLLLLGIWWRGLTAAGAASGMLTGALLVLVGMVVWLGSEPGSTWAVLAGQPALVSVPAAFLVALVVSRATRNQVPPNVGRVMLRLHAPDRLRLSADADRSTEFGRTNGASAE